jgi:hypothetical protein
VTRALALLLLLPIAAQAAGNAPGEATKEPQGIPVVRIAEVLWGEPVPGMDVEEGAEMVTLLATYEAGGLWPGWVCGLNTNCGGGPLVVQPPPKEPPVQPVPVPLPAPIHLLTATLAALILKGKARWLP